MTQPLHIIDHQHLVFLELTLKFWQIQKQPRQSCGLSRLVNAVLSRR